MRKRKLLILLLAAALLLCGCGSDSGGGGGGGDSPRMPGPPAAAQTAPPDETNTPARDEAAAQSSPRYEAPPFLSAEFHRELAVGDGAALIDMSAAQEGYVAVSAESASRLKFQIKSGDETYTYDLASDGTPSVFPLTCGNGEYLFRVMENVVDSRYAELVSTSCAVELLDEFQPFLRPSDYVNFKSDSFCVKKAAELSAGASNENGVVTAVYDFICANVSYDREKAATVQSGYLSQPDEILRSGKGICFDYAALAAAMLRSQGIPTKMIFGYVSPDGLYHAWNMFYTAESGWVTVGFVTGPDGWTRMDATFAAGGAGADFIGDGSNYSDLYCY